MNKINISEIEIFPIKPVNGLVGFASLIINHSIYLGSIGVMTRPEGGYRLTYPTKKVGEKDINYFYPISKEIGMLIEKEVTEKVNEIFNYGTDTGHSSK